MEKIVSKQQVKSNKFSNQFKQNVSKTSFPKKLFPRKFQPKQWCKPMYSSRVSQLQVARREEGNGRDRYGFCRAC